MAVTIVWLVLYTIVFAQTKNILNGDIGNYYLLPSLLFCSLVLILEIFSRIKFKYYSYLYDTRFQLFDIHPLRLFSYLMVQNKQNK